MKPNGVIFSRLQTLDEVLGELRSLGGLSLEHLGDCGRFRADILAYVQR